MADDADFAQLQIEQEEERRRLRPTGPEHVATGFCLWCDARLIPAQRWCDKACMDDHLRALEAERRNRE